MKTLFFLSVFIFLLLHLSPGKMEILLGSNGGARCDINKKSFDCYHRNGRCRFNCRKREYNNGDCSQYQSCCLPTRNL
uniref:Defensin-B6 n=1 Tax=Ornithorhynchus anatinus TaxID=9258 RepID=DEFB6_ORNAN|nr:RecName: Full=Defensin-B6; Short=DefB6; Short=OaDefB6; Flags: Precursor [Ornithorhynchus anatinus]